LQLEGLAPAQTQSVAEAFARGDHGLLYFGDVRLIIDFSLTKHPSPDHEPRGQGGRLCGGGHNLVAPATAVLLHRLNSQTADGSIFMQETLRCRAVSIEQ
jgi:hypothetical protein